MKNAKSPLAAIKRILEQVSKTENILPQQVSRNSFRKANKIADKPASVWEIEKLGGFNKVKEQLFPAEEVPVHPLAEKSVDKLDVDKLTSVVAEHIKECADSLSIPAHELTWSEFSTFIRRRWGDDNLRIARCTITRAGGFNAIREAYFPTQPTSSVVNKVRLREHSTLNSKLGTESAKQQFMFDRLEEFAQRVFKGKVSAPAYSGNKLPIERVLNLVLSDLHIGSDIKAHETGRYNFGKVEESRRIASVIKQVCDYKRQNRSETKLKVLMLGDMMNGLLHSPQDGAVMSEQVARCIHLLSQALAHLSSEFPEVEVECITGNHGRITSKHPKRAIHDKADSFETIVYTALKYACTSLKNVSFHIPLSPYSSYEACGSRVFISHGDTVFQIGNPSATLSVGKLESQINRINAALDDNQEYSVWVVGHIHQGNIFNLSNGATLITNGPLCPPDPFAISLGIFESACGQMLFESVKGYPVGDSRFIKVDSKTDRDLSLDAYIQPWVSF